MKIEKLNNEDFVGSSESYLKHSILWKINELIDTVNEITREDKNTVVSMINHNDKVIMATKYKIYRLFGDKFIELTFTIEE